MAKSAPRLVFHWPVAGSSAKIPTLLEVLARSEVPLTKSTELDELALEQSADKNRFDEARQLAEQVLGLIANTKEAGLQLTSSAQVVLKKRAPVQLDLLHYLFYTTWNNGNPAQHPRSWFYRAVCDYVWEMQNLKFELEARRSLLLQLASQALEDFANVPGFTSEKFSIGTQTMAGALEWLRQLRPPVLTEEAGEDKFTRRSACSAELFLLAISHSYQQSGAVVGMDLLLTPQHRDDICRMCLIEPLHFDRMLDWVIPIYPRYLVQGTRSGSYGRFVRLLQFVNVEDLA